MIIPKFDGVICVSVTPFDAKAAIDFKAWGKHLDFLVANGVSAIMPHGTTGEYAAQTLAERKDGLRFVAEHVGKRLPLYAGTNSARPDDSLELASLAHELGYQAQMLAAPFYALPSTRELIAHFRFVAANTKLPIILYNFPARTGVDMNKEFLEGLAGIEQICAIKESSGSFARMLEHICFFEDRFQRIAGADDQAVDAFLWGARAWIAGASNCLPAEHVALHKACVVKGDFKLGKVLMHKLLPLMYLLENGDRYLQYVKYGCELAGVPAGPGRRPLLELSTDEKAEFRRLFEQVKTANLAKLAA